MKDHAPLTYRDLKSIQEGNRRHPDVMMLLREVKRLRDLAALTYSILGYMPINGLGEGAHKLDPLFDALRNEPAVQEYKQAREKMEALEFRRRKAHEGSHVRQDRAGPEPAGAPGNNALDPQDETRRP